MKKIFLIACLLLGACGFSPLYKEVSAEGNQAPVRVEPIANQYGFAMRQVIQSKMGNVSEPLYTLKVSQPSFYLWDQTIDDKNFTTIMGIRGNVEYLLVKNSTKEVVLKDSASLTSSYSVVKDPYATTIAERKAKKQLAEQLAEQVSLHVLGTLAGVSQ